MNKTFAITAIVMVAVVMGISAVAPAMAQPIDINLGISDSGIHPEVDGHHCSVIPEFVKALAGICGA